MAEILTQEQIDDIIMKEHHRLSPKTCKNKAQKNNSWDEDIVVLRRKNNYGNAWVKVCLKCLLQRNWKPDGILAIPQHTTT